MKVPLTVLLALFAAALDVAAAEGRIRIQNPGASGRVEIVLSDEEVRSVTISVPGVISGERLTVEAPVARVTLSGGTIEGDPLLEALVRRKLRESSSPVPTVSVLPAPQRDTISRPRALNEVFTGVGLALWPAGYDAPVYVGHRPAQRKGCEARREVRRPVRSDRASVARSSSSSRAMMPRR
jgi:hypothetical protein